MSLPSGRCVGFEALVRWQHPTRGMVPPDSFISLAEGTGLIEPLTRYVLGMALEQCAAWRAAGHEDLPVAVNVSARNLLESDLVEVVSDLLRLHGVPATCLVLEVTERFVESMLGEGEGEGAAPAGVVGSDSSRVVGETEISGAAKGRFTSRLPVAEMRISSATYFSAEERSVCLPCPRKLRVGLNSPRRWPTMFSVT